MSLAKASLVAASLVLALAGFLLPAVEIRIKLDLLPQLQSHPNAFSALAAKNVQLTIRRGEKSLTASTQSLPQGPLKLSGLGLVNLSEEQLTQLAVAVVSRQLKQPSAASTDLLDAVFVRRQQIKRA